MPVRAISKSWRKRLSGIKDPVLFIESLPVRETRNFVEQVLTNYWIYQQRLGQPAALAGGHCGRPLAGLYGIGR